MSEGRRAGGGGRVEEAEPGRRDCNAIAAQLKRAITHTHAAHTARRQTRDARWCQSGAGAERRTCEAESPARHEQCVRQEKTGRLFPCLIVSSLISWESCIRRSERGGGLQIAAGEATPVCAKYAGAAKEGDTRTDRGA